MCIHSETCIYRYIQHNIYIVIAPLHRQMIVFFVSRIMCFLPLSIGYFNVLWCVISRVVGWQSEETPAPQALVFRPAMILCGASAYPRAAWLDCGSNGLAPTPRIRWHQISRSKMKKANGMVRMNYKKGNVDLATSIRKLICYVVESSKGSQYDEDCRTGSARFFSIINSGGSKRPLRWWILPSSVRSQMRSGRQKGELSTHFNTFLHGSHVVKPIVNLAFWGW